jgi:hypothetical protein
MTEPGTAGTFSADPDSSDAQCIAAYHDRLDDETAALDVDLKNLRALIETLDNYLPECGLGVAANHAGCGRDFDNLACLVEIAKKLVQRCDQRLTGCRVRRAAEGLEP